MGGRERCGVEPVKLAGSWRRVEPPTHLRHTFCICCGELNEKMHEGMEGMEGNDMDPAAQRQQSASQASAKRQPGSQRGGLALLP